MKQIAGALLVIALVSLTIGSVLAQSARGSKLIEFGWDIPSPQYLKANIASMEQSPFQGVVLSAIGYANRSPFAFESQSWSRTGYTRAQFQQSVNDLAATPFVRFTDNFMRYDVTPGDVDWFDDAGWATIVSNGSVAGWICKQGKLKGLMFDTEQYDADVFFYQTQPQSASKSFEAYQAQAHKRGAELAKAITGAMPDITILFTLANSLLTSQAVSTDISAKYNLLPSFLDGFIEGADARAALHDAMELSYDLKRRPDFAEYYQYSKGGARASKSPERYASRMHVSFGIWMDNAWRRFGWDPISPDGNYFQPDELRTAIRAAMATTDQYVWLYSEQPNWWTGDLLSPAYKQAVADGLTAPKPVPLDFNRDNQPDFLFQNATDGSLVYWLMSGGSKTALSYLSPSKSAPQLKLAGMNDINLDKSTDLLFQDNVTGELTYWLMVGTSRVEVGNVMPKNPGSGWNVVGLADLNGDRTADILFQNSASGDLYVWTMKGATMIGGDYITPQNPGPGWKAAALGDIDGDGYTDILFQNANSGDLYVWYLQGLTLVAGEYLNPAQPGVGWKVVGLADVDGDNQEDIIFQNSTSGLLAYWIMNGASMVRIGLPTPYDPGSAVWKLFGRR